MSSFRLFGAAWLCLHRRDKPHGALVLKQANFLGIVRRGFLALQEL